MPRPSTIADDVATQTITLYANLPQHGKPIIRSNGVPEWTILSAIHLYDKLNEKLVPISIGSGVKVLPASRLPPLGDTVHDCHAEILARRGLVQWCIEEAGRVASGEGGGGGGGLMVRDGGKFRLKDGVEVWMYVSALPCGDASTLHTAAHQPLEMAQLKSISPLSPSTTENGAVRGRNGYSTFGAIRTKPGRADSQPTISISCSDKIASWSVLGLQGALLSEVMEPIWVNHLVLGGVEEDAPPGAGLGEGMGWREVIRLEAERALFGRLEVLDGHLPEPYSLHRPKIHFTNIVFPFSKPALLASNPIEPVTSITCISYLPSSSTSSGVLFDGCRQGGKWKPPGDVVLPPKARSRLCKLELLKAYMDLRRALHNAASGNWPPLADDISYYTLKHPVDSTYQKAKALLRGVPERTDPLPSAFVNCGRGPFLTTKSGEDVPVIAPFRGWLVSGRAYEGFDIEGRRVI